MKTISTGKRRLQDCVAVVLLTLAALIFGFAPLPSQAAPGSRPNVLMIAIDDLNDWVGCLHGHPQARTPSLDRLTARGVLFSNAHCQAPLCNPSRASLLTGLRPSTTGIYGLAPGIRDVPRTREAVTLPQYFAQHGYFTAGFGKVFHDGSIPVSLRTNEFNVWGPAPGMPLPEHKFVNTPSPMRAVDWGIFPADDRQQADWKIADAAIAQLKTLPQGKPFFVTVGFRLPHVPCFASQKWFDLLPAADQITLPPYQEHDREDIPPFAWYLHWKLPEPRLSWLRAAQQWKPLVRAYLASTAFMDSQIGRVLETLDAIGQRENTIIVLWSDNAWHLGEKDITGKNSLWERSTHVPLIFAGPGIKGSAICDEPVELLDIYPTLNELCGLEPKAGLEGHSLKPQLNEPKISRPWPAISTHNQGSHSVRTKEWRYIRYGDGSEELYDHRADPNEWTNLAGVQQFGATKKELARWLPVTNAPPAPGSAHRVLVRTNGGWLWEGELINPSEDPAVEGVAWNDQPPADCPFPRSKRFAGIEFTGRHAEYTAADTWYPSWATDGNLYSPWTDGTVNGLSSNSAGKGAVTGHAVIFGNDPLHLQVSGAGVFPGDTSPYAGRYPCGSLVHNGVWYYGTYCLHPAGTVPHGNMNYNWPWLGPFVGFRYSTNAGKTWVDTPCTPAKSLFGESALNGEPVKIGSPHFVDFGRNLEHSPDAMAYLVAHGASDGKDRRFAYNSWITGDEIYLVRVKPSIENINDASKYEFFSGSRAAAVKAGDQGQPKDTGSTWSPDFSRITPIARWRDNMGCVTMTYNAPLRKYLMCVTDGGNTVSYFNTYILESDGITGPWSLVTYLKRFGEQAYFVNIPSKFISPDGRTFWLCYAANFSQGWNGIKFKSNPAGGRYGMCLQEVKLVTR